jgi:hypothetical protein
MLHALTVRLTNRHHRDDAVVENALLHSFGIHARTLIDFLWMKEPKVATDVVADDYFDDGWEPPAQSELLSKVKNRVGMEMVHLSYNRLALPEEETGWRVIPIGLEILGAFAAFAAQVPDDRVPEGWRDRAYAAAGAVP